MVALTQQLLTQHFPVELNMTSTPSVARSDAGSEGSSEPALKKARVMEKTPDYTDVDVEKIVLSVYEPKGGNSKKIYTPMLSDSKLHFNFTPKGSLVKSTWGFETNFRFEPDKKPKFLGGPLDVKNESLSINVQLTKDQAEFITNMDLKLSKEFAEKNGKKVTWHPSLKFVEDLPMIKVRVSLNGRDPTEFQVYEKGTFHNGSGWNFLKPWMEKTRDFGPCKAKVVLAVARIWELGGRAGITLKAEEMTLMPFAKPVKQYERVQQNLEEMMEDFDADEEF